VVVVVVVFSAWARGLHPGMSSGRLLTRVPWANHDDVHRYSRELHTAMDRSISASCTDTRRAQTAPANAGRSPVAASASAPAALRASSARLRPSSFILRKGDRSLLRAECTHDRTLDDSSDDDGDAGVDNNNSCGNRSFGDPDEAEDNNHAHATPQRSTRLEVRLQARRLLRPFPGLVLVCLGVSSRDVLLLWWWVLGCAAAAAVGPEARLQRRLAVEKRADSGHR
jgi:hypothetical protein